MHLTAIGAEKTYGPYYDDYCKAHPRHKRSRDGFYAYVKRIIALLEQKKATALLTQGQSEA